MKKTFISANIAIFILLSVVFYLLKSYAPSYRFNVLMGANALMLLLSFVSFFIVRKSISGRPEAFVRGVYGATFLKLMVCMASIMIYALLNKKDIHKPTLFILFGIYAVYTAVETWLLSRQAREVK
jgi:hypothetical protein